ncbi:RhoGAP domain-containing protein [Tieghemostelium lacteum]|uniref:RhoGAP domain-containing protein n=1 Tax=Tieghemostelium lacteum TaxID=361077 RepID=A0A151ZJM0_TIELA|nr:RhoGAP domain-containing protein [Tieghemostelium lacteum]|eukprot:KYQ94173.1 RhoGAP domain-containing protein [Tieghemostelium lacteum]
MTGETVTSPSVESFSDLWDGYEIVTKASEKGVLLLKDILKFFKKRIQSEDEYAKSLSKLVLKFEPSVMDGYVGSKVKNAWDQIRLESLNHSSYHENICQNIQTQICEPIEGLIVDLEQKLKVIQVEAEKVFLIYQESVGKLRKSKQNYDKLAKESLEVTGISKGETQKVQKRAIKAAQDVIKADKEYRNQITETNNQQKILLNENLPKIMSDLQRVEMIRIHFIKSYFLKYFKSIEGQPKLAADNDASIIQMIQLVNNEEEIQDFVRKSKQAQPSHRPKPFEYEPYIDRYPTPSNSNPISISPSNSFNNGYSSSPSSGSGFLSGSSESLSFSSNTGKSALLGSGTNISNSSLPEPSPTKDKKPNGGWSLKRLSSSMGMDKSKVGGGVPQAPKSPVFNCKIDDVMMQQRQKYQNLDVPFVLVILKRKLIQLDVFKTQGIFRVPGNVIDINAYKKRFDEGNFEFSISENVYTIASLLKAWLRDLPEPLFPVPIYDQCVQNCEKTDVIMQLIQNHLSINAQKVLSFIITLLQEAIQSEHVEISKMNSDNLAMVFSPCFLRSPYTDANILLGNIIREKEFVKNVIENYKPLTLNDDLPDIQTPSQTPPQSPLINSSLQKSKSQIYQSSSSGSNTSNTPSKPIPTRSTLSPVTSPGGSPKTVSFDIPNQPQPISPVLLSQQANNGGVTPSNNPSGILHHPKVNELKGVSAASNSPLSPNTIVTITPPLTPTLKNGSSNIVVNPIELLSPSEIKKRSNLQYTDLQEKSKELIDYTHSYINELYSDITTNEISCYYAMQSSLSIAKFTKSLENYITVEMQLSRESIRGQIQVNKFVSPPAIQFKIPTHLPQLLPSSLVTDSSQLLSRWLTTVTLTVNRLNEYLCYFGGIVMRIYSPDTLETITSLFESLDSIKPVDNPKYKSLTHEQADILTSRTLPLLEPLNEFTHEELNVNTNIKDTATPPPSSPPSSNTLMDQFKETLVVSNSSNRNDNNSNTNSTTTTSIEVSSTPVVLMEEDEIKLDNSVQFAFDDENSSSKVSRNRQMDNLVKLQINNVVSIMNDKSQLLNTMDYSLLESQTEIRLIAKTALSLKRELEGFVTDNNIYIDEEITPIIDSQTDNLKKLQIMTCFFISRINLMLDSISADNNTIQNQQSCSILNGILEKYE